MPGVVRSVMWAPWDGRGLEHLALAIGRREVVADAVIIGQADGAPFRARYRVRCDAEWRVGTVRVDILGEGDRQLTLHGDDGRWTTGEGAPLPALDGCVDIDISATPFTNTLPIRRLRLAPGEHRELAMTYIRLPELAVERDGQRYTCLDSDATGGRYLYQSLDGDFTAELPIDADGLVLDYPGLFRRVPPG